MGLIGQLWRSESIFKYNAYLITRTTNWDTFRFLSWLPDMQITCMWHHFVIRSIGIIWVATGPNALPKYFLPMNSSASQESVCLRWEWGKGGMYIKDWFRRIFHILLNRLLCKLKFLIPMVDFWLPSVISKVMPMIRSLHISSASADCQMYLRCKKG
jgi:hypothetical protein